MQSLSPVIFEKPESWCSDALDLSPAGDTDVVVDMEWTGISTGTERLLWSGRMPPFPGMGYPLVPGYESVGRIAEAGARSGRRAGERVFVPGASCFGEVRGLFGGAASRVVVEAAPCRSARRRRWRENGVLLALAATAHHAISDRAKAAARADRRPWRARPPDRAADDHRRRRSPVVWEREPKRRGRRRSAIR